ncbi:glycerate kinase [Actinosynnema sp. ALI-1.44]|uniref:glycerate kinase family protein n=1 Tax=Actinosynnema sp. ALI-1.44 TaxID=1933779 RepID=UPI00097C44CD|nr:glycerate kinase [Actinosynnema sp. ALI-1.44]ONI86442.1 glycerate kinase [Actinosynnema sp. ALI-1.44]
MRFTVAPSGFKESLDAPAVAAAIARGIRRVVPGAVVDEVPLVDGGEGSAKGLAAARGGQVVPVTVTGPVGTPVESHIALLGEHTAALDMAAAAGLRLVPGTHRDPGLTTTYGVGELITAALDHGARTILIGCGDSGTCDGGAGALEALGARILDADAQPIGRRGGYALRSAAKLDTSAMDPRLARTEIVAAVNPHNLLTSVAAVFGPQKGATPPQVDALSDGMDRWAGVLAGHCGLDLRTLPGSGASGGLGAGLAGALGAALTPRFDVLLDHTGLDARLAEADLVITAEGAIDHQTPHGKIPAEVAVRAKRHGKPVIALAGTIGDGARHTYDIGIDAYAGILPAPVALAEAIDHAAELLTDATERTLRLILLGAAMRPAPCRE